MQETTFASGRKALVLDSKNASLLKCQQPLEQVLLELAEHHIEPLSPIVTRTGAVGEIKSVYLRDPDGNLIEISTYKQ